MNPFQECNRDDVKELMEEYIQTISSPIDSFLENHILNSKFYQIYAGSFMIGYFAIHNNEKMTQFYIRQSHLHLAQDTFKQVLECYFIRSLFVPTCDELFLGLALDQDFKIEKQAYFFQDSKQQRASESLYSGGEFRLAREEDVPGIIAISGDFFSKSKKWQKKKSCLPSRRKIPCWESESVNTASSSTDMPALACSPMKLIAGRESGKLSFII